MVNVFFFSKMKKRPFFSKHLQKKKRKFSCQFCDILSASEVAAHWISSYFQNDKMHLPKDKVCLPSSTEEAIAEAGMQSAWMRARYPGMISRANESYSTNLDLWRVELMSSFHDG